ncbi:purine-nucleoside phosphorylase [Luteolibacter sp. AS25]|uniref:purine-nucleoside phosphorylase n=1 Tax=Luteolibacter sp. AS25 TaxID=3135776 RepID=UPI00398AD390
MTGIVLGSGLGVLADQVEVSREVAFEDAGLAVSTVPGHSGKFVFGKLGSSEVVLMKGRVHLYEGHSAQVVTAGVRWMKEQGVESLILTNAAGTVNKAHLPGEWMMLSDHLNLTATTPLMGANFVDMSEVYDRAWRAEFEAAAKTLGMKLNEGVYAGLRGPQYETPAEVRMVRTLGADAVGMSTVLEAIQAKALGMRVAGFSCLTNWAAGMQETLNHEEVLETGKAAGGAMVQLLEKVL